MSDSGTDTFFGVIAVLAIVVGITAGAGGATTTTTPSGTPTSTPTSLISAAGNRSTGPADGTTTNIPGGTLLMCTGTVIEEKTRTTRSGTLTVQVYYSPINGGRNCAVATTGGNAFAGQRGIIKINLHFTAYQGKRWPRYARHNSGTNATRSGSVYLDDTDHRCVRSTASFRPATGGKIVIVTSGRTGCG